MVPNGWNETKLGDVIKHQKGYAFKSESYKKDGIRIIRISDTSRNSIHDKSPVYLAEDASESLANYKLREDDIILSTVGSRPHLLDSMVGKAVKLRKQDNGALLNQNLVKVSPKPNVITNDYLFSMLTKSRFIYFISTLVRGNANQVSVTLAELFSYKFLLPPYDEQRKIAKILSAWDKAISTTERLIDNSKQQKKALMQQLLTGKKRLLDDSGKTFESEWDYVRAGNIFLTRSNKKHDSDLPILAITQDQGAIPREFIDYNVSVTKESISGYKVVEQGDFIISLRSFQGGIEYSRYKGICSPAYVILYPKIKIVDAFYKYHLKSHIFIQAMKSRLEGIRDGKIISYKYFSEIKLPKPSLEEQQKIASVLTNADKEIELLEQQLTDLKLEKKALMQQLLTGKHRVKVDDEALA